MCVPAPRSQALPCTFHHLRTQLEEDHLRTREWVLLRHGVSDFQLPEKGETNKKICLLLKPPSLWLFVIAAQHYGKVFK